MATRQSWRGVFERSKKHAIPATMFICPGVVDTTEPYWWQVVEEAAVRQIVYHGETVSAQHRRLAQDSRRGTTTLCRRPRYGHSWRNDRAACSLSINCRLRIFELGWTWATRSGTTHGTILFSTAVNRPNRNGRSASPTSG
jgi:hypothetical protein